MSNYHEHRPRLITNTAAKQRVIARLQSLSDSSRQSGCYQHGGRFVQGMGLNASLSWGEHSDGIRRYYDGVLVHEEAWPQAGADD